MKSIYLWSKSKQMSIEKEKAALIERIEAIEDRTIIGMLNKFLDIGELDKQQAAPPKPNPKRDLKSANKSYFSSFMKKKPE